nr:hypothetical protein [Actinomycetota bacterium]NIW31684.1 hypothetical protein [Actinomycetota bacterium]
MAAFGRTLDERVVGFIDEPLGTMSYTSRDRAEALLGGSLPASSALVRYEDG